MKERAPTLTHPAPSAREGAEGQVEGCYSVPGVQATESPPPRSPTMSSHSPARRRGSASAAAWPPCARVVGASRRCLARAAGAGTVVVRPRISDLRACTRMSYRLVSIGLEPGARAGVARVRGRFLGRIAEARPPPLPHSSLSSSSSSSLLRAAVLPNQPHSRSKGSVLFFDPFSRPACSAYFAEYCNSGWFCSAICVVTVTTP